LKSNKLYSHLTHMKIVILTICIAIASGSTTIAAEKSVRVAITPFTLNAPADMAYLKPGLQDMLESRLSQKANVTVISREETALALKGVAEPIDELEARDLGSRLSADYVLIGSLTVFGASTSVDARLVDVTGTKPTTSFFEQGEKVDDLVPKIDTLAADIGAKMIGVPMAAVEAAPAVPQSETAVDVHAHPEKMAEGMSAPPAAASGETDETGAAGPSDDFWKSRRFKILMNGIALGDVDGDGNIETVVITPDSVIVYRIENNRMFKTNEFKVSGFKILIGVDVADINGNGVPEIFVTAQNTQKSQVYSDVFEFDGKVFAPIVTNSHWKFRVVEAPRGNPILLGQKHVEKKPFSGAIFQLHWEMGDYQPGDSIGPPSGLNLMGVAYGDATNSGENSVVAYDDWDHLQLIDATNEVLWKQGEKTGGSTLFFVKKQIGVLGSNEEDLQYLPMRILIRDVDNDGRNEVIAVKNYDLMQSLLSKFRKFSDGEIRAYAWDGVGLFKKWATRKTSGYMRDFAVGDFNNDGRDELVVALVLKEGRVVGTTPVSTMIAYQF